LKTHGAEPEQLEPEITESTIMADPARAFNILTRINRMGVALFIDDFGTVLVAGLSKITGARS
jgi:EAL domain-containing protein (putative c-di-GMP-specific phosphodiesterase class I)